MTRPQDQFFVALLVNSCEAVTQQGSFSLYNDYADDFPKGSVPVLDRIYCTKVGMEKPQRVE
jgi:hypothetical protein